MFLRRKKRLEVDCDGLEKDEKELLSDFLRSSLKVNVVLTSSKLSVDSEHLSTEELKRLVNKFVYHRNLNRTYWVALEDNTVRVHKFERAKKQEKRRKATTPPTTVTHGW